MENRKNILAICGSTRKQSSNLNYIRALTALSEPKFTVTLFEGLDQLPHFNPDLDTDHAPETVVRLREQLRHADGILICTPEYAMGVPGTLKNALDWVVSSASLSGKPTALVTASTSGEKAHESLLGTLQVLEANITADTQLLLPYIKTKVNDRGQITHMETLEKTQKLVDALGQNMNT